jgi:hypothetical protein
MNYTYPLIATHIDGGTILLYTREEVLNFRKTYGPWHKYHRHWVGYVGWKYLGEWMTHEWIVRDDWGKEVFVNDFEISNRPFSKYWTKRMQAVSTAMKRGLPIPSTGKRKWHRHHAPAKKNSGSGHRNRNRAKAIDDAKEYGIKNDVGNRVIPWEGY